jgi:hypothetical protein
LTGHLNPTGAVFNKPGDGERQDEPEDNRLRVFRLRTPELEVGNGIVKLSNGSSLFQ